MEIAAMTAILLTYIWGWQGSFVGSSLLVIVLYFGLAAASQFRRREMPRQLGFRFDNAPTALRNATLVVVPILAVFLTIGAALGSWHFPSWKHFFGGLPWLLVWDLAQQYGLLCFFYRRFLEILDRPGAATLAASITFAGFHAPNPFLMAVTLGGGAVACGLYRRAPNVFVIGVAHAALSYVLYFALPIGLTHALRVGPGYYAVTR
jgi:hypothetical protein